MKTTIKIRLTDIEYTILFDLAKNGGTERDAAKRLNRSYSTIKNHLSDAYAFLGVTNRLDAFRILGWLRAPEEEL